MQAISRISQHKKTTQTFTTWDNIWSSVIHMTWCEIAYSKGTHFSELGPVSEPARTLAGRLTSPWPPLSGGWADCWRWRVVGGSPIDPPPGRTDWPCTWPSLCMDSLLAPHCHLHPTENQGHYVGTLMSAYVLNAPTQSINALYW